MHHVKSDKELGIPYVIYLPKNSSLEVAINKTIDQLSEKGIIAELQKKWKLLNEH